MTSLEERVNDIYYRIIEHLGELTVAELQWFDEFDFNQDSFLNDKHYETEEEAQSVIDQLTIMGIDKTKFRILARILK
jgi:hypothetical protein